MTVCPIVLRWTKKEQARIQKEISTQTITKTTKQEQQNQNNNKRDVKMWYPKTPCGSWVCVNPKVSTNSTQGLPVRMDEFGTTTIVCCGRVVP